MPNRFVFNKHNPNFDDTTDIFDFTEWIILRNWNKRTFYNRGQKLWPQLRKSALFVSQKVM